MSSKLEQLKKMTLVVADTGDLDALRRYQPTDATTNPSLLLQALALPDYQPLAQQARQLAKEQQINPYDTFAALLAAQVQELVPGYVSIEVDARTSFDRQASLERSKQLVRLVKEAGGDSERLLIKLAATWEGIQAAQELEQAGIRCNLTLVFGFAQARACADAGVTLISPFVGRILDWHQAKEPTADFSGHADPGVQSVQKIFRYYKERGYPTIVMGASFRNQGEIEALAGCDRLTISPTLLNQLEEDTAPLEQQLHANLPAQPKDKPLTEAEFRLELNADAMATEKLAEGIRRFIDDLEKLETQIQA